VHDQTVGGFDWRPINAAMAALPQGRERSACWLTPCVAQAVTMIGHVKDEIVFNCYKIDLWYWREATALCSSGTDFLAALAKSRPDDLGE
jgi:hypothetical protein